MAHAVTHVLLAIIAVDIYRDYIAKKKFSLFYVYLAGFFALLPDIDLVVGSILGVNMHGTVTHWVWWPLLAFVMSFVFFKVYNSKKNKLKIKKNKRNKKNNNKTIKKSDKNKSYKINKNNKINKELTKYHKYGMITLFIGIGLLSHLILDCAFGGYQFFFPFAFNHCPSIFNNTAAIWADAIILIGWLGWEWRKHNIKDFV